MNHRGFRDHLVADNGLVLLEQMAAGDPPLPVEPDDDVERLAAEAARTDRLEGRKHVSHGLAVFQRWRHRRVADYVANAVGVGKGGFDHGRAQAAGQRILHAGPRRGHLSGHHDQGRQEEQDARVSNKGGNQDMAITGEAPVIAGSPPSDHFHVVGRNHAPVHRRRPGLVTAVTGSLIFR